MAKQNMALLPTCTLLCCAKILSLKNIPEEGAKKRERNKDYSIAYVPHTKTAHSPTFKRPIDI